MNRRNLENYLTDRLAYLFDVGGQARRRRDDLVESLAQDIAAWDTLYQHTRTQLAVQQEAHRRLLATLAPLADRHPEIADALKEQS